MSRLSRQIYIKNKMKNLQKFTKAELISNFKEFTILRRLYLIFNGALMAIFGISMIDIYGLSIFSAFFTEITYITTNIINYLTNTHFYSLISGFFGYKVSTPTKIEPLRTINQSPTRIQTENPRINKVNG